MTKEEQDKNRKVFNVVVDARLAHKKWEQHMKKLFELDPTTHYELRNELNERRS
jgi:alkyl hydroperoxide reductase subunit AhpC